MQEFVGGKCEVHRGAQVAGNARWVLSHDNVAYIREAQLAQNTIYLSLLNVFRSDELHLNYKQRISLTLSKIITVTILG